MGCVAGGGVLKSLDYGKRAVEAEMEEEEEQEFDPPDGLEEEIDTLMESLSDKVSPIFRHLRTTRNLTKARGLGRTPSSGTRRPNTSPV